MAFPDGAISLDIFDRASNGLGDDWGTVSGYETLHVVNDNSAGATNDWSAFNYWSGAQFAAHQEVYATMATAGTNVWLGFRLQTPDTSPDGYRVECRSAGGAVSAHLVRVSTGAEIGTAVAMGVSTLAVGDSVGVDANGSTITLYYRPAGGAWGALGTWTDSTIATGGYIGLGAGGWPRNIYVATSAGGVFYTSTFTAPDDNTQPTWTAVNGGLGALTIRNLDIDPFDCAGRQVCLTSTEETAYIRYGTGDWQSLITQAQVRAATNASAVVRWVTFDRGVSGRVWVYVAHLGSMGAYRWFGYTDNDGDSWTWIQSGAATWRAAPSLYVNGNTLWASYNSGSSGTSYLAYSNNLGVTWTQSASLGVSIWDNYVRVNPLGGTYTSGNGPSGPDLVSVTTAGVVTALQDTLDLGGDPLVADTQAQWFSANLATYQRILDGNKLYTTVDAWTTVNDAAPSELVAGWNFNSLVAPMPSNEDWMILGPRSRNAAQGQTHVIYTLDSDTGTPVGKAGADPAGGANSIPASATGLALNGIGVVG